MTGGNGHGCAGSGCGAVGGGGDDSCGGGANVKSAAARSKTFVVSLEQLICIDRFLSANKFIN